MMSELAPVLVLLVIFGGIVGIIRAASEARFRNRLIEKGMVDEKVQALLTKTHGFDNNLNNLKWGMVLMAIGLAALLSQILPYDMEDGGTIGLMFIFGGLAFLIYYPIAQRCQKRQEQDLPRS